MINAKAKLYGNIYDGIVSVFAFLPFIIEFNSPFTYFYQNYILYSLVSIVSLLLLTFYRIPKLHIYKKLNFTVYFMIPIIYMTVTIWFIPKFIHYNDSSRSYQCFNANLKSKSFSHTSGDVGRIRFDIDYTDSLPKEMMFFRTLPGIDEFYYNELPKKGEKIRICGQISKIGFSFDTVEAVRDENVSVVP